MSVDITEWHQEGVNAVVLSMAVQVRHKGGMIRSPPHCKVKLIFSENI